MVYSAHNGGWGHTTGETSETRCSYELDTRLVEQGVTLERKYPSGAAASPAVQYPSGHPMGRSPKASPPRPAMRSAPGKGFNTYTYGGGSIVVSSRASRRSSPRGGTTSPVVQYSPQATAEMSPRGASKYTSEGRRLDQLLVLVPEGVTRDKACWVLEQRGYSIVFPTSPNAVVAALLSAQLTAVIGTPSTSTLSRRVLDLLGQLPEGVRVVAAAEGLIDWVAAVDVLAEGWGAQRVESMKSKELLLALQPAGSAVKPPKRRQPRVPSAPTRRLIIGSPPATARFSRGPPRSPSQWAVSTTSPTSATPRSATRAAASACRAKAHNRRTVVGGACKSSGRAKTARARLTGHPPSPNFPVRQPRYCSNEMRDMLNAPTQTAALRPFSGRRHRAELDIRPKLLSDDKELAAQGKKWHYGEEGRLSQIENLKHFFDELAGLQGGLSISKFRQILKAHGVSRCQNLAEKLWDLCANKPDKKYMGFEGLLQALSIFSTRSIPHEITMLYKLCALSGPEITKAALLRFLSSAGAGQYASDSFEAKLEYDKMERISNGLFLELDADGGGTIDEEEFVDGLLQYPKILERFNQVNPVKRLREAFHYLPTPAPPEAAE